MIWAQLSRSCIELILAVLSRIKLGQLITVKQFLLGLMAAATNGQYAGGLIYKSSGMSEVVPSMQSGAQDSPMVPGETAPSESNVPPWAAEFGSRHRIESCSEARGMEVASRD